MNNEDIYDSILIELAHFRFNRNSMGYEYLIDAIYLVTREKKYIKNFNQYIYPIIAEKYETKPENVMWCISKLLNLMYINTNEKVIEDYFNLYYDDDKPSPKAFIMCISRKIQNIDELGYAL